jgi:ribose 5-phosphate isomerase B
MGSIFIGADHRGYYLKEKIKNELSKEGLYVIDCGNKIYDKDDDYSEIAISLGERVVSEKGIGILICGSAIGICIAANKVNGIRAALCLDEKQAKLAREHNDANILCLAADLVDEKKNLKIVKVFLETLFSSEERHIRRIQVIKKYENTKTS